MDQTLQNYFAKFHPGIPPRSIQAVLDLTAEGGTVPFIARYRKEKTGNLDEVQIRTVVEGNDTFQEVVKRKAFLIKEIAEQNNLTDEIKKRIDLSWDLGDLEEIYRPFKKKKKTKATIAREAGLDGLAQWIWDLGHGGKADEKTMEMKAKEFINPAHKIQTYEDALKGTQDILVERIANEPDLRLKSQKDYLDSGKVTSKSAKGYKPNSKYEMYKEFEESVKSLLETKSSHRYMAMRRGWQEEELSLSVSSHDDVLLKSYVQFATTNPDNQMGDFLANCAKVALNVYVLPSIHNEMHRLLKDKSDLDGIKVFTENVRKLLLASPFGSKCVLGVDPGLRTGCKVALVDKGGNFISHTVMQILGEDAEAKAKKLFSEVLKQIHIDAVAVGNGTAGRQTETFVRKLLKELGQNIPVVLVNESGASVYSASDIARQEFPDLDLTVKGAISIARRLQDPLAELVKVDPKSIGVGQYQHDVNQSHLKKSLDGVVESCVNAVGVDVNTASASLLAYVSGIGPALAQNIVEHRKSKGLFAERNDVLKVTKFSTKIFEQCAGFLRIQSGKVFLDSTGIHPERYSAVKDMALDLGVSINEMVGDGARKLLEHRTKWAQLVGEYTFDDIFKELEKPGRDPRDPFKAFQFRDDIFEVKDLKEGFVCPGIVTNVTNFGAFVDIGVHQDGLVHISELSHKFVEDPRKVVNPGDQVQVRVLKVDTDKNQIALSMKMEGAAASEEAKRPPPRGAQQPRPKSGQQKPAPRDKIASDNRGPRPDSRTEGRREGTQKPTNQNQDRNRKDNSSGPQRPQSKPFNNPFANLAQLKK